MNNKLTLNRIINRAKRLKACNTVNEIENLLKLKKYSLIQNTLFPEYYYFQIPKSKGGFRDIEAPSHQLKTIQRKLNEPLQCVYYLAQTRAAYGFIINTRKQAGNNNTKNIVTNAKNHLGKNYLVKMDFDDFFHQISNSEVAEIYRKPPLSFNKNVSNVLAKICTYKGRLPMGAPTSPVLSNFACMDFDKEMSTWAHDNHITFTRFVDDLSFSSENPITQKHYNEIIAITGKYGFIIEPSKTKWYGKKDEKIITGLLLKKDKVDLQEGYLAELDKDLDRLQKTVEVEIIMGSHEKTSVLKKFKQEIMGKINFIAMVKGYDSKQYNKYLTRFEDAVDPPEKQTLSLRWMDFNNYANY